MSYLTDEELEKQLDETWGVARRDPLGPYTKWNRVARRMNEAAGIASGTYLLTEGMRLIHNRGGALAQSLGLAATAWNVVQAGVEEFMTPDEEPEPHEQEWGPAEWADEVRLFQHYRYIASKRDYFDTHPAMEDVEGATTKHLGVTGIALGVGAARTLPRYRQSIQDSIQRHRRYHDLNRVAQIGGVMFDDALDYVYERVDDYLGDDEGAYDVGDDAGADFAPPPEEVPVVERRNIYG